MCHPCTALSKIHHLGIRSTATGSGAHIHHKDDQCNSADRHNREDHAHPVTALRDILNCEINSLFLKHLLGLLHIGDIGLILSSIACLHLNTSRRNLFILMNHKHLDSATVKNLLKLLTAQLSLLILSRQTNQKQSCNQQ